MYQLDALAIRKCVSRCSSPSELVGGVASITDRPCQQSIVHSLPISPLAGGLQDLREAYPKIDGLCLSHCVFYSGRDLFDTCHPSSTLDGKTKSVCPLSEVGQLAEALFFTGTLCRATYRSRTGEAGGSVFNRHGPNRNRYSGAVHRRDIEAGHY
jgi:hypothetical protein